MYALMAILMLIAGIGHLAIWTRLHCFFHAKAYSQWLIDTVEMFIYAMSLLIPILFFVWWLQQPLLGEATQTDTPKYSFLYYAWLLYGSLCVIAFVVASALWLFYQYEEHRFASYFNQRVLGRYDFNDIAQQMVAATSAQMGTMIPGNEILKLEVNRKELFLPRLPKQLDGLTLTHISDLHLKGHMTEAFYRKIIAQVNDLQSDLIIIAGDVFDHVQCFAWSTTTLGQLTAPCGTYFVLGNHEIRTSDPNLARKTLVDDGLIYLGGRHMTLLIRDYPVVLAGHELPWHPPAPDMSTLDSAQHELPPFKLLVAHTPDQFGWAAAHDFDLMLAGHVHGGQIRLPGLGPIVSPSLHGTRYACGVFYSEPTLMHVSRGISGTTPLRINCLPEITQLVLRTGN